MMKEPRELMIKEVAGGLTEDKKPAIVMDLVDIADQGYRLTLAGKDMESFEQIWRFARQAIADLEAGRVLPDKHV